MPSYLSHTNRQGDTAYIKAVSTAKGGTRYYVTKDPKAADLLEEMPSGFEFYEYPSDARVVFRKRVLCRINFKFGTLESINPDFTSSPKLSPALYL